MAKLKSIFPILVIGDTHCPCMLKDYPKFLKKQYDKYKCKTVVHIGDLVDNHRVSVNHIAEAGWYDYNTEVKLARKQIQQLVKIFPSAYLCVGNHDDRLNALASSVGIPKDYLKSLDEQFGLPKTWKVGYEFILGNVRFRHGTGRSGNTPHLTEAVQARTSSVIGHCHSVGGCEFIVGPSDRLFGLSTGCGVDRSALVFKYGSEIQKKPVIGCGIVLSEFEALFVPMDLGSKIVRK